MPLAPLELLAKEIGAFEAVDEDEGRGRDATAADEGEDEDDEVGGGSQVLCELLEREWDRQREREGRQRGVVDERE
jgi:hypothetical protein